MLEIRRASESDAQTLTDLGAATFIESFGRDNRSEDIQLYVAETFGLDKQLSEIRDSKRNIEIAWVDDQPAGYFHLLAGVADPSVHGALPIEISKLFVDSKWHGAGEVIK